MDDRALATSLAGGHPDGLLAVCDDYADRLFGYALTLLGSEDAAIGATRDALLVAAEQGATLTDPARLGPWLHALTRNECVRRLTETGGADPDRELAALAGHRFGAADLAAILGLSTDEITHRLRLAPAGTPADGEPPAAPPALREQVAAGAGADAADYRAALVRRAGPFGAGGFPQPLDQRRLTGRALAWSTAAAVLVALALLLVLPGDGSPAAGTALAALPGNVAPETPGLASRPQPSFATRDAWPLPPAATLRSVQEPAAVPAGPPAVDRPAADDGVPASPARPAPAAPPADGTTPSPDGRREPATGGDVVSWYQNRTAPACGPTWTARLHAVVVGVDPTAVGSVVARWVDAGQGHQATFQRSGREWAVTVTGLPTGRQLVLTVRASTRGGTLTGDPLRLFYRCG